MRWTFHGICNVCQYEQYVCVYPKSGNFCLLNFCRVFLSLEHTDVCLIFVVLGHRQNIFNFSIYIELP